MWKIFAIFLWCIFYSNYVEATYNTGINTRVYTREQPIKQAIHHQQQYTPTHGHYHQQQSTNCDKCDSDYQTSITQHDNSNQQQHREGSYYQPAPEQSHYQHQHNRPYHQQQVQPQSQSSQPQPQPIYERVRNTQSQTTGNLQNSRNFVNEFYTGCPSGYTGQLPYAYDCRRFLNCWHGRGHIQTCSVGTVFNPETLECDRPDKVKCETALSILGAQSQSNGSLKQSEQPNYRAGRYTDISTDSVEVLCPPDVQGLQPHPSDCTRFINCVNGNVHVQQCGPGTAFSIPMKVCEFKDKVDCSGRESGEIAIGHRKANNEIVCPWDASGLYPHPHDCTKFLQCSNGATYIQDCGPGTAFDSVRLLCDYKAKVKCCSGCTWGNTTEETITSNSNSFYIQESSSPKTQHEDLPHTADILCPNNITGLFPYPFDYTKFIHCKNGNTAIQNCVSGTAFSISKGYCESLDDIQQTDHVIYIVSQVSYEYSQTLITCPPGTEGLHLYPFNAEKFVKCVKSQMTIVPCGISKVFSITRRSCLPISQVLKHERVRLLNELQTTNNYRLTEEHYSVHNMVYCPGGLTGTYPHPFDSTKYLKCIRGRLFSESCASGQAYSLSRKVCSLKEDISVTDRVPLVKVPHGHEWNIRDMEVTHGSIDGLTYLMCPPGMNGYFLHPFDCTKYIECRNGVTVVDECAHGTVFSISRQECIARDKVEAYDRVEYMTTTKNEFSNEARDYYNQEFGFTCNPGTFGIYPHPQDCNKYMRCANGRLSVENCPIGQVFSVARSSCHNENEVDTNDRSSYNRGRTMQSGYVGQATTTTNTVYQSGSYNPVSVPQMSLSPPSSTIISPPSVVLSPPLPSAPVVSAANDATCPEGATGRYPHPYDCTKFLMCTNGETHIQNCGPGTAWNKAMEVCDFKDNVKDCSQNGLTSSSSSSTIVTTSQSPFVCPAGIEGLYHHPYDWHKYLVCSRGQTTVMDCAPGTVFSISRKVCDLESNVLNTDRCNNGVYSSDYDYTNNRLYNNRGDSDTQWSYMGTQNWPTTYTQVTENRWTNMNVPRPQSSPYNQTTNWQQTSHTYRVDQSKKPDVTPVWSGTAEHVEQRSPTHTIIYEEGSFEPNRNYNSQIFNTPLAPMKPTTSTSTSTIVYAQPVGSQEDSKEIFTNTPPNSTNTFYPYSHTSTVNRQNHTKHINIWTPIRPVDIPRHDLMPSQARQGTVYTNTRVQIPESTHSIPPYQQNPEKPLPHIPATHLMPPYDEKDTGQALIPEKDFKITTVNIDKIPGQLVYNLNDLDQLPSASSKHNVNDVSNLFGGLQPPLHNSPTTITTSNNFLDPYDQTTQIPLPARATTPTTYIEGYPQLSNVTIQSFPHQPHYSPPYSEVIHSRNSTWAGRKLPSQSAIKPSYKNQLNTEKTNTKITSPPPPHYYGLNPLPHANNKHEKDDTTLETKDQEQVMKAALKLLLRPYLDSESKIDDGVAEKAQSHIMSLVTSTTTTTHKPPSFKNTLTSITTPHQEDAELILAGEQHNLIGVATSKTASHETSTIYNLRQDLLESERSSDIPNQFTHDHNTNWHKHHTHHSRHHSKLQHSREFHEKHPNLPNPFADTTKPISSYNAHTEAITSRNYNFDLRVGGQCPFNCGNGKCIEQHQVCDGANNCGNHKDEQQCDHLGYELRLTGGQSSNMGRVEVKILGKWGYVCDDKFGLRDADVVCRELGFKMGAMEVRGNSYYPPSDINVHFVMDEVECKGNETSLKECDFKGWGVNNCGPDEVVGVVCKVPKLKCPDNYWLCSTSKECIPTAFLCDVTPDCEDGSDESEQVCNAPIKYRLEGGRSSNEGRLEVFYRGEWGTVCDDDFGLKEAQVACNSFGLYGKPEIAKNIYGPGSGPIWLDQVSCLGNETKIDECNHWSWGENNCNHTEDVGVKCRAGPRPEKEVNNRATSLASSKDRDFGSSFEFEQSELDDLGLYQGLWQRSSKAVHSQKKCGHFKTNLVDEYEHPEERVVNGSIAKRGRHPWQATIRTRGRGGISSHWCGAVIISKKLILTAAHCLAGYPKGSYFVRMGDHYANIAESSEVDSNIENWYIHEKFRDEKHMNNDIALILLKTPIHFNDYIQPICLPEKGTTLETNRICTISGWGSIKSGTSAPSNILRSAQVPILADEVCRQKNVYANAMTEGMFCAGFLDESVDACDGDSGGPLVCSDQDGETLYGIISWGQHCGYANHPGVYVRVEKYIDWIYDKINLILQSGKL